MPKIIPKHRIEQPVDNKNILEINISKCLIK